MKSGRNDLCPCGSGKKYKKCCLLNDQAAEQAELARIEAERLELAEADSARTAPHVPEPNLVSSPPTSEPPPDPRIEALNARWREFQEANDDGRWSLFAKTLDEPELMDDEMAFEMLNELYGGAVKSGEHDRWEELVDQLRERFPDVYATSRKYYLQWRIANALASRRPERVLVLAQEMAETAGDDVDQFARVVDLLAYHGQLTALAQASRIAWPLIKDSSNILWGQGEFARWGADCVLFERLERTSRPANGGRQPPGADCDLVERLERAPELNGRDPELIEQVRFFLKDLGLNPFAEYVSYLSGRANRTWSLSDFQKPPRRRRNKTREQDSDDEEGNDKKRAKVDDREALAYLVDEFVDYARHQEGVPYTKAALARDNISRYILERQDGDLEPHPSMFEEMMNPQPKPQPKLKSRVPDHPLCPDRDTLDRYFSELLHFMNPQTYDVAATFELIPAWLRFLETRGLIEPTQREATLAEFRDLQATLLRLWEADRTDPTLVENLRRWPETAELPSLLPAGR